MIKVTLKLLIVIFFALVLAVGLDVVYRKKFNLQYNWPRNILPYGSIEKKYDLVVLGNSHAQEGITLKKYRIKSLPLAAVAQSFEYDFAMLKMHSKQINKNAIILINVSPISFSQNKPANRADVNMNYYDGRLSPIYIPKLKIGDYLQIQILPFTRSVYLWRKELNKLSKDAAMDTFVQNWKNKNPEVIPAPIITETLLPRVSTAPMKIVKKERNYEETFNVYEINDELNAPFATSDAKLNESVRFMVEKWEKSGGFSKESFSPNARDLQDIINYCLSKNWRPVLITIPINQKLVESMGSNFLDEYIYRNIKTINDKNIPYLNFAEDKRLINDKFLFGNSDHLNKKGAAIFSYVLLRKLIEEKFLPESVDGYDYSKPIYLVD